MIEAIQESIREHIEEPSAAPAAHGDAPAAEAATPPAFLPERSWLAQAGVLFGMFALGPVAGGGLALAVAPESGVVEALCFFSFPLVFGVGYKLWSAQIAAAAMNGLLRGVFRALWMLLVRRKRPALEDVLPDPAKLAQMIERVLRATSSFRRVGILVGCAVGLLLGVLATEHTFWEALVLALAAHAAYGQALTMLARAGYMPPPESL